ncbi:unnamed protein product [Prorocentrum cordatum]|uniref:Uncharacterized protein n=1 Tax=Prorocentrum cordatum TaxID=2364126 RepID=A0ABN9UEY0_9DINO|nr:unnamed protein product [Polarella glacialis]
MVGTYAPVPLQGLAAPPPRLRGPAAVPAVAASSARLPAGAGPAQQHYRPLATQARATPAAVWHAAPEPAAACFGGVPGAVHRPPASVQSSQAQEPLARAAGGLRASPQEPITRALLARR